MRRASLVLLFALLVAGCGAGGTSSNGEPSKSADEIVSDAQKAAKSAEAVHVSGKIFLRGTPLARSTSTWPGAPAPSGPWG